jgi:hypothetical protein
MGILIIMRKSLSLAAALLFVATGSAFAAGGANSDRGDTNPLLIGNGRIQVESSSQTADAGTSGYVESLR